MRALARWIYAEIEKAALYMQRGFFVQKRSGFAPGMPGMDRLRISVQRIAVSRFSPCQLFGMKPATSSIFGKHHERFRS
jgi:hypothetical protein